MHGIRRMTDRQAGTTVYRQLADLIRRGRERAQMSRLGRSGFLAVTGSRYSPDPAFKGLALPGSR